MKFSTTIDYPHFRLEVFADITKGRPATREDPEDPAECEITSVMLWLKGTTAPWVPTTIDLHEIDLLDELCGISAYDYLTDLLWEAYSQDPPDYDGADR